MLLKPVSRYFKKSRWLDLLFCLLEKRFIYC